MPARVSWTYDYTTEPWLRWLARAGAGALVGGYALLAGTSLGGLVAVLLSGSLELRLLVALLLLVGGPFSFLYLVPILRDPDQRRGLVFSGRERRVPLREWLACGVVGAAVLGASALLVRPLFAVGLAACGLVAGLVAVLCSTRGAIDRPTATAESGQREWDLSRVTGYETRRLGPLVLVSFQAAGPGRLGTVPSRIVVPAAVADDVTAALDEILAADRDVETRDPNTAVRVAALCFAVLFAGGAIAAVVTIDAIGWYVAAIGLLFGSIFLFVAHEG